jgi:hypothetical protein
MSTLSAMPERKRADDSSAIDALLSIQPPTMVEAW